MINKPFSFCQPPMVHKNKPMVSIISRYCLSNSVLRLHIRPSLAGQASQWHKKMWMCAHLPIAKSWQCVTLSNVLCVCAAVESVRFSLSKDFHCKSVYKKKKKKKFIIQRMNHLIHLQSFKSLHKFCLENVMNLTKMDQKNVWVISTWREEMNWTDQQYQFGNERQTKNCKFVISLLRQWFSECFYGGKQV